MPKVTFVHSDGKRESLEVPAGVSIKDCALRNGVGSIKGECGGAAMCGTCHVYVDDADIERSGKPNDVELEILEVVAAERRHNSRLSCQILLSDALDGITVHLPDIQ